MRSEKPKTAPLARKYAKREAPSDGQYARLKHVFRNEAFVLNDLEIIHSPLRTTEREGSTLETTTGNSHDLREIRVKQLKPRFSE